MKQSVRERFNISRYALKYAPITIAFWIAIAVAGIFAFSSLKFALFPDIAFPVVIVNASVAADTALATESQLTRPLEKALRSLEVPDIFSSTYPGQTVINIAFAAGTRLDRATQSVKEALKPVKLPQSASIEVIPLNLNESPAITYAIASNNPNLALEELLPIVQTQVIPALAQLTGIRQVNLLGDGLLRDPTDSIHGTASPPSLVSFNGQNAIAIEIIKRADANTLNVVKSVNQALEQLKRQLPTLKFSVAETQAPYIQEATLATVEDLIGAIILAVLVIAPFLRNFQATMIAALAIPLSLLGTAIFMAIAGLNLEVLTLLALALVIGIIVDDAIVDVENIARHIEEGASPKEAAIQGTDEIGLSVTVSTLTIVAVFLPIALMGGTLGQFFKPFGLTISVSVLISLLVARTLSPVLASYWLKPQKHQPVKKESAVSKSINSATLAHNYRKLLAWSLNHRKAVLAIALASFIFGIALIPFIPKGFIPDLDRGEFNLVYSTALPKLAGKIEEKPLPSSKNLASDPGFSWMDSLAKSPSRILLRRTRRVGNELEKAVEQIPEVESVFMIAGVRGEPNRGKLYVRLKRDRQLTTNQVQAKLRQSLPKLAGVTTSVEDILFVETGDDTPIKLVLQGENLPQLTQFIQTLQQKVQQLPGLVDVKINGNTPNFHIDHYNGLRSATLSANLAPNYALGTVTQQVSSLTQSLAPPGIKLILQGDSARSGVIFQEFGVTLLLAIACMLFIVYLPFGRLLEPLVVGLSLPLAIVGSMVGLLVTQSDFGMISLIGLIFLLGLLDKNAILLMDYTNQLRQKGIDRETAILTSGAVRLRPIIMTTAATILGMTPIALGLGAGAELRQPMAVAIIGGLFTSSLLSLIVVPVLYTLLEDYGGKFLPTFRRFTNNKNNSN